MKADSSLSYLTVPAVFGFANAAAVPGISVPSPSILPPAGIVWEISGPALRFSWPGVMEIPCARISVEVSPGVWEVVEPCIPPADGGVTVPAPPAPFQPTNYQIQILTPSGWGPPVFVFVNPGGPQFKINPHQVSGEFGVFLSQSFTITYADGEALPAGTTVEWLSVSYPSGWPRFLYFYLGGGILRGVPTNGPGVSVPFSGILFVKAKISFSPTNHFVSDFPIEVTLSNTYQDPEYYVLPQQFTVIRGEGCYGDAELYGDCRIPLTMYKNGVSINNSFGQDWVWGGPIESFSTSSNCNVGLAYLSGYGYINTLVPGAPPDSFWSEGENHVALVVHELYVYGSPVFPMRIGFLVNFLGS